MSTAAEAPSSPGLNFDNLLTPVAGDNPAGVDPRTITDKGKSMVMAAIEEKRKAILSGVNENLEQGSQVDADTLARQRKSEWKEIERLLTPLFAQGKELGTAVMFTQAAVASQGWVALAPSLRMIRQLQENFWDTLYPVPETDDEGKPDYLDRLVALERLDHENFLPLALRQISLTDPKAGVEFSWADQKQLEILKGSKPGENDDADTYRRNIEERSQAFTDAVSKSSREYYDKTVAAMRQAGTELEALRDFINERYASAPEDERPSFHKIADTLEECQRLAEGFWKQKGGGAEEAAEASDGEAPGEAGPAQGGGRAISDTDVIALLEKALASLRANHKHNPAAFLVEEAIRWTKMPISAWYLESIDDTSMAAFIAKLMRGPGNV